MAESSRSWREDETRRPVAFDAGNTAGDKSYPS